MTRLLADEGIVPCMAAGLSLGEYSALYAAGVFDEQTVHPARRLPGPRDGGGGWRRPSAAWSLFWVWGGSPCRRHAIKLQISDYVKSPTTTVPVSWSSPERPRRSIQAERPCIGERGQAVYSA